MNVITDSSAGETHGSTACAVEMEEKCLSTDA